jgi:hypothetical protein
MISPVSGHRTNRGLSRPFLPDGHDTDRMAEELERLRAENRRLAVSLGGFSAFMASRGLLEDAWQYVHTLHQLDED